jgi:hypothetical protein
VLVDGAWVEAEPVFAFIKADRLTRQAYRETFGRVPALPPGAFSSDPSHWPIRYGHHKDGTACRFRDAEVWEFYGGEWHEIMPSELVYNIGVLTERAANVRPDRSVAGAAPAGRCFPFRLALAVGLNIVVHRLAFRPPPSARELSIEPVLSSSSISTISCSSSANCPGHLLRNFSARLR